MKEQERVDLSVCSPNYNKKPQLKNFVESIMTQDYPFVELIIVDDGSTDGSWELLQKLEKKYFPRLKVFQQEHAGACQARNLAVSKTHPTSKYWCHLPSDSVLFPGMIRHWVQTLDDNPEYGFLYGGYRFSDPLNANYMGEPFDVFKLTQYNYIDGSFPYRKELFPYENNGGWDKDIPSLQDWDFWLAIVLGKKAKGLYNGEVFFETIPPQPKGLSEDSANNWVERVQQIRRKWNIPVADMVVTGPGAPFHAQNMAEILGADYNPNVGFKPHWYKMVYLLGFYTAPQNILENQVRALAFSGKKVIHWIGTDIFQLLNNAPPIKVRELVEMFRIHGVVHLAEFNQTKKELIHLGFTNPDPIVVPLPLKHLYKPSPLPKELVVGVYAPHVNEGMYNIGLIKEVAKKTPEISYKFYGNPFVGGKDKDIKNIEYVGMIPHDKMEDFIKSCRATIRLTAHDGFPASIGEFITAGRNALFNLRIPYILYYNNARKGSNHVAELTLVVRELVKLPLNEKGSKYYRRMLSQKKYRNSMEKIYNMKFYHPESYWENRAKVGSVLGDQESNDPPHLAELQPLIDEVKPKSILDVGCGDGRFTKVLSGQGKYTGIDIAPTLVEKCREKFPKEKFYCMKVESLLNEELLDRKKYDLVFAYNVFQHIKPEDLDKAVQAVKLVGKKMILVEPTNFERTADYCFDHPHADWFHIEKKIKLEREGLGETHAYLIDLQK